ncbi:hypothetical protein HPT27_12065 [Permianibacter sp. IMCC34836]|uniref:hypothetical protein n=1 Tax=Permianibacter fluminis TaxID=2738515 RepID=UPI001554951F|nr:hypothetical protein [Permianibacter fluminis]NQD37763.1 hypothetical protein [Permianibacter fluminis]
MNDVSLLRLYVLRALYLLITVGLATVVWPDIFHHAQPWNYSSSVIVCMLVAFSLLSALGIRYPLQMLPVLMWELLWKTLWLVLVPLPQWWAGTLDEATAARVFEIAMVVLVYLAIPWRYVYAHYLKAPGSRWK